MIFHLNVRQKLKVTLLEGGKKPINWVSVGIYSVYLRLKGDVIVKVTGLIFFIQDYICNLSFEQFETHFNYHFQNIGQNFQKM